MGKTNKIKIAFYTLGCKVNFSETSFLITQIDNTIYNLVDYKDFADIYVIHSCMVTSSAEKKTRYAIMKAHRKNNDAKIIVIGCLSQLKSDDLMRMPGVSHVLGNVSKFNLNILLDNTEKETLLENDIKNESVFHLTWSRDERTRSFLKIQDGCDCYCNYCIVPFARGKSRSASIEQVLNAVEEITKTEYKEIVFTGINLGDFGKMSGETLSDLLKKIRENNIRIRLSSIEPHYFNENLIKVISDSPVVVPHFHIPIQSGNDLTLKRMGRNYSIKDIEYIFNRLKKINANTCICVDVITGFPGETAEEFNDGYKFLSSLPLSYIHVFPYSARKGTIAADFSNQIPTAEKKERAVKLLDLSEKKKTEFYQSAIKQKRKVIFENMKNNGMMYGYTDNYIKVCLPYDENLINNIIEVELVKFSNADFIFEGNISQK